MVGVKCRNIGGGRRCWFDGNELFLPEFGRMMKRNNPQGEDYDETLLPEFWQPMRVLCNSCLTLPSCRIHAVNH